MKSQWLLLPVLGLCILGGDGGDPFIPKHGALPFFAYFRSRYRGLCSATVISPVAVLTAAVCVTSIETIQHDHRPLQVIFGTTYRHLRRGIRVSVQKILFPILPEVIGERAYILERAPAVLVLQRKVPDSFVEVPLRSIPLETDPTFQPKLQDECFMPGFHFFHRGQVVYPGPMFLLQKKARVQFLNVVQKHIWCGTLAMKFQTLMVNLGYQGMYETSSSVCVKDPERYAQPCHAMYGSPLICNGKAIGQMSAPDAQWSNCTGMSNLIHLFRGDFIQSFMQCIQRELVDMEFHADWRTIKSLLYAKHEDSDYLDHLYDHLQHGVYGESSSIE